MESRVSKQRKFSSNLSRNFDLAYFFILATDRSFIEKPVFLLKNTVFGYLRIILHLHMAVSNVACLVNNYNGN
jgi:hypothetical protein